MKENVLTLSEQVTHIPTKVEIQEAATTMVARVTEGYMNPLLALGQLTALEEMIKIAKGSITEAALAEAERYEQKNIAAYNCDFQIKEAGVKYDYSGNEYWRHLKEAVDTATAELKGHEATLKALKQCAKSSTTIVQVTLRKQ